MRRQTPSALIAVAALMALTSACITGAHQPRNTPFLKTVVVDGMVKYRVGAQDYEAGIFGDLAGAVATVPEARDYAEEAEANGLLGLTLITGGAMLAGVGAGLTVLGAASGPEPDAPEGLELLGVGLAVAGLAATIGGAVLAIESQAGQFDAINAFNDAMWDAYVERRPPVGAPLPRTLPPRGAGKPHRR